MSNENTVDVTTNSVASSESTAMPSGVDPQASAPASEDTSANGQDKGKEPDQSRRDSRAFASMRRENRELHRALGRMEAKLEALGQPAPTQTEDGQPPQTRQGPTPEQVAEFEAHQEATQSVVDRLEDALDQVDGGDEVMKTITKPNFPISPVMRDFLGETEQPAQMAKWLAENPDEARRISRLSPVMALRALERAEAKTAAAAPGKRTTQAPAPLTKVGGSSQAVFDPNKGTMDDYAKWRSRRA